MKAYVKPPDARMPDRATKASIGITREVVQSQACTVVDNPKVTELEGAQKEADSSPAALALATLQRRANESSMVQRQHAWQEMADASPWVTGLSSVQRLADAHSTVQRQMAWQDAADASIAPVQRSRLDEAFQRQVISEETPQAEATAAQEPLSPSETSDSAGGGLPNQLRAGIERLSGMSVNHVKVHRNSSKPGRIGAHAFAQGADIHLGPGQERHLPHEAWHVVQQAQGRVRPTVQAAGVDINDDPALEAEADRMGGAAQRMKSSSSDDAGTAGLTTADRDTSRHLVPVTSLRAGSPAVAQRDPIETGVTGLTHPVRIRNGSIYEGEEAGQLIEGQQLVIDTHDRILSRRGPNQEVYGAADFHGGQSYAWVRVLRIGEQPVRDEIYVREDSLTRAPPGPGGVEDAERRERLPGPDAPPPSRQSLPPESQWFEKGDLVKAFPEVIRCNPEVRRYMERSQVKDSDRSGELPNTTERTFPKVSLIPLLKSKFDEFLKLEFVEKHPTAQNRYRCLAGCHAASKIAQEKNEDDWPITALCVKAMLIAIGALPSVIELIDKQLVDQRHIDQQHGSKSPFRDWYQDIAGLLTMLAERPELPLSALVKLLKFQLMRFQLQAPIDDSVTAMTGRQISPLTSEDYARGMQTRLWKVATEAQCNQLIDFLVRSQPEEAATNEVQVATSSSIAPGKRKKKKEKAPADPAKEIRKNLDQLYYSVSTPQPFPFMELVPRHCMTVPVTLLREPEFCFLAPLRLQLFPIELFKGQPDIKDAQALRGRVSSHMGAHGQRSSLGESADILAEAMARLIKAGGQDEALALLASEPRTKILKKDIHNSKRLLQEIQYDSRMMVATVERDDRAGRWRDPLLTCTTAQLGVLSVAFAQLVAKAGEQAPDILRANIEVLKRLTDNDMAAFFGHLTPGHVVVTAVDALDRLCELALIFGDRSTPMKLEVKKQGYEQIYFQMQTLHEAIRFRLNWTGGDPTLLDRGIRAMLPENTVKPHATYAAPYGLAMINQVGAATGVAGPVGVFAHSYYETAGLFPKTATVDNSAEDRLRSMPLIVMEPHPNNAEDREVRAHDPLKLLEILEGSQMKHTVIMDVTLNHLGEGEIAAILKAAAAMIQNGKLNLILMQSGTKFLQHGMDIVSLGIAAVFNDGRDGWVGFNSRMEDTRQSVPRDDALYLGQLLTRAKEPLGEYLDIIRHDTRMLKHALLRALEGSQSLEVTLSTDDRTIYVAIAPTKACVEKLYPGVPAKAMEGVYEKILVKMRAFGLATRSSFGFNLTNLSKCETTIRITPGIEGTEFMAAYAAGIGEVSRDLDELMGAD